MRPPGPRKAKRVSASRRSKPGKPFERSGERAFLLREAKPHDGGYGILLNNHSAVFCGGAVGCTVAIKGTGLFQGEVLAGLSMRF